MNGMPFWKSIRVVLLACVGWCAGGASAVAVEVELAPEQVEFFEKQVRPLLVSRCYECHSATSKILRGKLRLDSRTGWMAGGENGPVVVPGDPGQSRLIEAIRYESLQMPPQGKLPSAEIAVLEKWIAMGAPDPRVEPIRLATTGIDLETGRQFWSFQPIQQPVVPPVQDADWPRNAIDHFILAKLEAAELEPVGDANRATLLRRLFFDLIGLPPTPDEVRAFAADRRPDAVERVVDDLLSRPQFGERWGRHWLDVARYADSNGLDENFTFYDAWRYRNYVIAAFNSDKPFDRLITEQVAGDLLPYANSDERDENLTATGYLVLGPKVIGATDKQQLLVDAIDEQIDSLTKSLLGLTVGCARCHDHKFDPIPQTDYYALAGIFASTETVRGKLLDRDDLSGWNLHPLGADGERRYAAYLEHEQAVKGLTKKQRELQKRRQELGGGRGRRGGANEGNAGEAQVAIDPDKQAQIQQIDAELTQIKEDLEGRQKNAPAPPPLAMSVNDQAEVGPTQIRIRGVAHHVGESVPRGFLSVVPAQQPTIPENASGRVELARWLTAADNPLPARVAVNRVWHYLFGQGLVRSVDDFGTQGEAPSHPELLDHLAARFRGQGWSVKELIREIVLSRTYQLSSTAHPAAAVVDPENRLLSHMNRRRLEAEPLRDAVLAISGQLDLSPAASVVADLSAQATGIGVKPRKPFVSMRRSIYLPVIRNDLPDVFQVFDFTDPATVTGRRNETTVAPQALYLMNSPLILDAAAATAKSLLDGKQDTDGSEQVKRVFELILNRRPTQPEIRQSLALLAETLATRSDPAEPAASASRVEAWSVLCQALFCSTQFQFVD